MKTLNINSYVRIKLTTFGIEKLKENHERLYKQFPSIGKFIPPKVDKDGFYQMQLWEVMNTFGKYLYNGSTDLPFEMNIQIDD
jgi:hypothetical protein